MLKHTEMLGDAFHGVRMMKSTWMWAGNCDLAVEFYLAQGFEGVRRDGVWTGLLPRRWGLKQTRWRLDGDGRPVHSWIECADGTVVDPTRWVLEGVFPYIYRGPSDFYDFAVEPLESVY